MDCANVTNGTAYLDPHYGQDSCTINQCVEGNTGNAACTQDCAGQWGGTKQFDLCGIYDFKIYEPT